MISEQQDLRAALEGQLRFDALLAEVAAGFVRLPADLVDAEIEATQRRLCALLGFDRSSIWELKGARPGTMTLLHLIQREGLPVPPSRMDAGFHLPYVTATVLQGRTVVLPRIEDLPPDAAQDQETFREFGTRSTAVFPLRNGDEVFGAVSFAMTTAERGWPEPVLTRLGLIAQVFADAIGRKRSEEALRQTRDRMGFAAEAAGAGLWELDLATGCFWGTDKAWELIGMAPDPGLTYERCLQMVHPQDRYLVEEAVQRALASNQDERIEFRVLRPDGAVRWLRFAGRVRLDHSREAIAIMGASADVTARKQTEAALREVSGRLITAQEKERAWLAKELHDGLSQHLALLAVELDLLGQQPPETTGELRARAAALSAQARSLSGEVHRLSHGLHPAKLERLGLVAALGGFCREVEAAEGPSIRFTAGNVPRDLPEDLALCLYRVAQEAIWNAVKHSGATQVTVELSASAGEIRLGVADDGRGFDPASAASPDALGLISMRERVGMVQGQIAVESGAGKGTGVRARIPLPAPGVR